MLRLYLTFIDQTTVFCDKLATCTNTYYMLCPTSPWTNSKSVQINMTILVILFPGLALPSRDWIYASFRMKVLEAISRLVEKIARFLYWSTIVVMYKIKENTPILTNIHLISFLGYHCVVFFFSTLIKYLYLIVRLQVYPSSYYSYFYSLIGCICKI